jgi:hypothetical protein
MSTNYQGTLQVFNKVDVLEPNNACSFWKHMEMSKGCWMIIKEPCGNIDKANVFEPNIAFILRTHRNVKMILKDYWKACKPITKRMFLNQTTQSLWKYVKMSKWCSRILKEPSKSLISWLFSTKQCIHLWNTWKCENDVGQWSRSLAKTW